MAGWSTASSRKVTCLGALLWVLTASSALAQSQETCVFLPPPEALATDGNPEQTARDVVLDELTHRNVTVLPPAEARLRMLGEEFRECSDIDCAAQVNRFLGTAFAVRVEAIWSDTRLSEVSVAIIGLEDGESVGGQAPVETDVAAAARRAFRMAWDRWTSARQGQLVVRSEPDGAMIELDGSTIGRAPLRRLAPAGMHRVRASLEGYEPQVREVTLDSHEEREVAFELSPEQEPGLIPEPPGRIAPPPRRSYRPWYSIAGPTVLAAGGIALLTLDIVALAELGCATRTSAGFCTEERVIDELPFTFFAVGAALLLTTAIVWFAEFGEESEPSRPLLIEPGRAHRGRASAEADQDDEAIESPGSSPATDEPTEDSPPDAEAEDAASLGAPGRIGLRMGAGFVGLTGSF